MGGGGGGRYPGCICRNNVISALEARKYWLLVFLHNVPDLLKCIFPFFHAVSWQESAGFSVLASHQLVREKGGEGWKWVKTLNGRKQSTGVMGRTLTRIWFSKWTTCQHLDQAKSYFKQQLTKTQCNNDNI